MRECNGWDPSYAADDDVSRHRVPFVQGVKGIARFKVITERWALNAK